jgi:hypothetical protein
MAKEVFESDYADYDALFNDIYTPPTGPGVKKWQIFSCNINNKMTNVNQNDYGKDNNIEFSKGILLMYFWASNLLDAKVSEVMIQSGNYPDQDEIRTMTIGTIDAPTIQAIKQWELFKNYCLYVPDTYHAKLCPQPSAKVMNDLKKEREEKAKKGRKPKQKVEDLDRDEVEEVAWRATQQAHHPNNPVPPHVPPNNNNE